MTGVCKTCKQLKNALHPEDEQCLKEIMEELRIYLRDAIEQRKVYKERVKLAIDAWEDDADFERLTIACIAFDYASSAHLPSIVLEAQADWIANRFGLEVRIFGVTNEGVQWGTITNERFSHVDAESVMSLLHLFFRRNPRVAKAKLSIPTLIHVRDNVSWSRSG